MTVKRTTIVSTRWELKDLDDIEKLLKPDGAFNTTSEAIRECTKVGVKVHNYQTMMEDPEKAEEFRKKMQEIIENEEMDVWADSMSHAQMDGFILFLQMKKDQRYKVAKLI